MQVQFKHISVKLFTMYKSQPFVPLQLTQFSKYIDLNEDSAYRSNTCTINCELFKCVGIM